MLSTSLRFQGILNEKQFAPQLGVWIEWFDPTNAHYYTTNELGSKPIGKIVNGQLIPFQPYPHFTIGKEETTPSSCLIGDPKRVYVCKNELAYEKKTEAQATKDAILPYDDGSCYIGEVRDGKKHGKGILSTLAFVYTAHIRSSPEDAHLAKWNEYDGQWVNDKMHGYGKMVRKCRNGNINIIYEGIWQNGVMIENDKL
jgi:hypothetical protein